MTGSWARPIAHGYDKPLHSEMDEQRGDTSQEESSTGQPEVQERVQELRKKVEILSATFERVERELEDASAEGRD
ncbi:MAG TPA: hypothetical protein VF511_03195 [Chthoniobacterales bacterium]